MRAQPAAVVTAPPVAAPPPSPAPTAPPPERLMPERVRVALEAEQLLEKALGLPIASGASSRAR
jgi:hypothetical protein